MDPYLVYFLASIAEVFGYALCHLNDRFNRKILLIIFFGLTGSFCLIGVFIPNDQAVLVIIFALVGKAMASAAYNSCYLYTSQQFPTNVRNTYFMFASSFGRIGSIIAPQINLLQKLIK